MQFFAGLRDRKVLLEKPAESRCVADRDENLSNLVMIWIGRSMHALNVSAMERIVCSGTSVYSAGFKERPPLHKWYKNHNIF